jgi:V-type H+-transporting ATPase subunit a
MSHDPKNPSAFGVMRYFALTSGMAAFYCGIVYNECFALKLNLFESCYDITKKYPWYPSSYIFDAGADAGTPVDLTTYPNAAASNYPRNDNVVWVYKRIDNECVYPFGFDPAWAVSSNDLTTSNGIKMKLSVIFAIFHMTIGVLMKGTNQLYHK